MYDPKILKTLQKFEIDTELICDIIGADQLKEDGNYLFYTGKGVRTGDLHIGHYFLYKKLAQISHKYPVWFQLSTDQKRDLRELDKKTIANLYGTEFKNKNYLSSEYIKKAKQDLLEVLSRFSWNTKNTLFFDNLNLYDRTILDCCAQYLSCFINPKTIEAVFGLKKCYFWYYILLQLAPVLLISELKKRTTVILTEADQVGFFYILRDICNRVNIKKPIVIVVKGIKGLDLKEKMSSVKPQNCVLLLKENVLSKLRKGISGQDPQSDFCHHLLQNGLKLVENSSSKIQSELEDLLKNNNTFKAKVSLSQYFEKFFENKKRKLNFGLKKDLRLKNLEELEKQFETCFEYKT